MFRFNSQVVTMLDLLRNTFRRWTTAPSAVATDVPASPVHPVIRSPASSSLANAAGSIFIDTETTGLNKDGTDEVLEIAIVDSDGMTLLDTLVRPVRHAT